MRDVQAVLNHEQLPPETRVLDAVVREGLSVLFDIEVHFACEDPDLDLKAMLWSTAALQIWDRRSEAPPRFFHGVIEEAAAGKNHLDTHEYRLRLRPSIHGLAYRKRTRIFQDLDAVDIIKQVFDGAGIAADSVEWRTAESYPVREYCTQWKESELDFVLRLLEHEGIFFFFEHTATEHLLVMADQPFVYADIEQPSMLPGTPGLAENDSVSGCAFRTRMTHDAHQTRDWNFEYPETARQAEAAEDGRYPQYQYPGGFRDDGDAARLAQSRLEEAMTWRYELEGVSICRRLEPGKKFALFDIRPQLFEDEFVAVELEHRYSRTPHEVGGVSMDTESLMYANVAAEAALAFMPIPGASLPGTAGGSAGIGTAIGAVQATKAVTTALQGSPGLPQQEYSVRFRSIRANVPFRPPRVTPKPIAHGLDSAVVTGPAGEEIHVDQYGRVKVHFYWDREQPVDDTASCWIRVQQMNTTGSMILPRLGWELHIAYLNGDPDRPIAFHKAYNLETMPPYGLPGAKTSASLQTVTTPGGGSTNEVRLEDAAGGQEFFVNASKDLEVKVGNNTTETIAVDSEEKVGSDSRWLVSANESISIAGDQSWSVKGALGMETTTDKSVSVGGNDDWGVKAMFSLAADGDRTETIGGLMNVLANTVAEEVAGSHTRTVGGLQAIVSATAIAETVGGSKTETVGAAKIVATPASVEETVGGLKTLNSGAVTIDTGGDVTMEAKGAFAVTSAGAIDIKAGDDFALSAKVVAITAPGGISVKAGGTKVSLKGGTVEVDASKFGGKAGPALDVKGPINYKV